MKHILAVVGILTHASTAFAALAQPGFTEQLGAARQQAQQSRAAAFRGSDERSLLLERLGESDPAVRRHAVSALKGHVAQSNVVRAAVLRAYRDANEAPEVRFEAAKTLSWVSRYPEVHRELMRLAADPQADADLRGISYKALYPLAASDRFVRTALLRVARNDVEEVRRGATWALFSASQDPNVAAVLVDIAFQDVSPVRATEALRSLYLAMSNPQVRQAAARLATDRVADARVRRAAILLLSAQRDQYANILDSIVRLEEAPSLRQAAAMALDPQQERAIYQYFHLPRQAFGEPPLDPIENEQPKPRPQPPSGDRLPG